MSSLFFQPAASVEPNKQIQGNSAQTKLPWKHSNKRSKTNLLADLSIPIFEVFSSIYAKGKETEIQHRPTTQLHLLYRCAMECLNLGLSTRDAFGGTDVFIQIKSNRALTTCYFTTTDNRSLFSVFLHNP